MTLQEAMIPTPVGVNRFPSAPFARGPHDPHTRGGEPILSRINAPFQLMIPTPVGVNRRLDHRIPAQLNDPHTHGGEPSRPMCCPLM